MTLNSCTSASISKVLGLWCAVCFDLGDLEVEGKEGPMAQVRGGLSCQPAVRTERMGSSKSEGFRQRGALLPEPP